MFCQSLEPTGLAADFSAVKVTFGAFLDTNLIGLVGNNFLGPHRVHFADKTALAIFFIRQVFALCEFIAINNAFRSSYEVSIVLKMAVLFQLRLNHRHFRYILGRYVFIRLLSNSRIYDIALVILWSIL